MNIFRMAPLLFLQLIITASLADEVQVVASFGEAVPLEASDLDEIRLHVVGSNPELASSPGIKFGHAVQGRNGSVEGGVIFHPHSDAGGVKEALQVSCSRSAVGQPWVCEQAMIRRYFRTGGQDFEFRVVDGILGSKESIAVVEASGNSLRYIIGSGPQAPCEALSIMEGHAGGYLVLWRCGDDEEATSISLHATATPGSDLTRPDSWRISEYVFPRHEQRSN